MNTVWIVLPVLIALMFQLGIELDRQAFAGVARRPAAVVAGLLGQLALLPLIAFGVGLAFRLPPVYFLGLLLVACCPGGSSSNVFSMLAKGDVALSVTLTALSSLITLFTIPLVMGFAARFVAVHAGAAIELPVGKLLVQNIVLLFLPMLCGALFRHWRPRAARRVHELLGRVAFPALMLLAAVFFVQYASTILENLGVLGLAAGALRRVAGVAVDREFLRAFGRGAGRLFATRGDRHVGGRVVAFIGVCGEFLLRAQVDGEGLARDVVLGLGDHADHVVVRGQHGDAGVAFALGFDVRDDRGRVVGAGGEHGVGDLRAVHRQRRERGGRVRDELAGRGLQLDLGQAGADHAAGGCGVGVGDRDLDERGSHRSEVIGVRLDSVGRLLGRDGLRGSEIRPVLAVRGDLDLRLAGVGEPHRVAVAEEVHDNLAELLLGRVLEGDLGGVVAGLRVRPVGPC